jgi:RHS repeat-associated protein
MAGRDGRVWKSAWAPPAPLGVGRMRRHLRAVAIATALILVPSCTATTGLVQAGGPLPASKLWHPGGVQKVTPVAGHAGRPPGRAAALSAVRRDTRRMPWSRPAVRYKAPKVTWPSGSGTVTLAPASGSPSAARSATVSFASRTAVWAAGIRGVVFRVARADGGTAASPVKVSLNYSSFAGAFGGGYADRLRLVELPACALTTPRLARCRAQTPLSTTNDTRKGILSARVTIPGGVAKSGTAPGGLVLAGTASPSGGTGTYTATSLSPEGSWSAGGNSGAFTYNYPIQVPPSTGGSTPTVTLAYDSESVDGRTSATNAQASWIGDGWDYTPGFIERSYQMCSNDGIANSADQCWGGNEVTLSLNGASTTLVRDDVTGTWKEQNDTGDQVIALTGANNGAWQGEAWEIIAPDGTRYYFGENHLPGGDGSDPATNSAWTEPVYCPKGGDGPPSMTCHNSSQGQDSVVTNMAWRWNLDYVIDPHGNLQVYSWTPETNYYDMGYAQGNGTGTVTQYDRGGYLDSIGYGYSLPAAQAGAQPTDLVSFAVSPRCQSSASYTCSSSSALTSADAANWPDAPGDQVCEPAPAACSNYTPTFFSTIMLSSITTKVLAGSAYDEVDSYALQQSFPEPQAGLGEGTMAVMWLDSIQRTGDDTLGGGSPVTNLPATKFTPDEMSNRVDGDTTGAAPLYRPRLVEITTEAGAQIVIAYSAPQCSRVNNVMPAAPDQDTMNCFPEYWTQPNGTGPVLDWFNTYQVTSVTTSDLVAPKAWSEASVVSYSYDGAAWHRDDSPLTPDADRTWGQFRGFRTVTTTTGTPSAQSVPEQTVTTYLQGMDGDYLADGSQRSVAVTDTAGDTVTDSNWLAGQVLETDTLLGAGGPVEKKVIYGPWSYTHTASQAQADSMPALVARMEASSDVRTDQLWHDGTWEQTGTATTYNANGQVATADATSSGDSQIPEVCSTTTYAANPSLHMYAYPDEVRAIQGPCGAGGPTPDAANTVSDTLSYYDGSDTLGSLGAVGDATETEAISSYDASGNPVYVMQSKTAYDSYGRVTSSTNADGHTTLTAYSPVAASPDTVTTTDPMGWTSQVTLDPGRGSTLASTDVNGELTTQTYDGLGRLTAVWSPLHSQANGGPADQKFAYSVTGTAPSTVSTSTLRDDGLYGTEVKIYDAQLRLIQDQAPTVSGDQGRLIADTHYNSLGQTFLATGQYYDADNQPSTTLTVPVNQTAIPKETQTAYDGMGRPTQSQMIASGVGQYATTTTTYEGMDETDVTPPAGGTAASTFTDALGRTSATWKYTTPAPTGHASDAAVTSYTYTPSGQTATIQDTAGNTWRYTYNLLGQQTATSDPGTGTSTAAYSNGGKLLSATNADGTTLSYTYDALGRKTAEYNTTSGAAQTASDQMAAWTYDTLAKGQPTATTTYADAANGANDTADTYTEAVTGYTPLYQSTGESVTVPAAQGALAGTYQISNQYKAETSLLGSTTYGADGGLPAENLTYSYSSSGALKGFGSPYEALNKATYNPLGQVVQTNFGANGQQFVRTDTYDQPTGRLLSVTDKLQTLPSPLQETTYTYNDAGTITSETSAQYGVATADTQCFTYNHLSELTAAWTDTNGVTSSTGLGTTQIAGTGGCDDTAPVTGKVTGGPAPYWDSYTYDALGDRTTQTNHDTSVSANTNTVTQTLAYTGYNPTTGTNTAAATPDAVQSVTTTNSSGATLNTSNYTYFPDGATQTRAGQKLTYTAAGLTASVQNTATGATSTYTYDADGTLLVQADPASNQRILYLPWGEQLTLNTTTNAVSGLRYFTSSPDGTTVVHSSTGAVYYELTNTNGTATTQVNAATLAYSFRYFDPFGGVRGTAPSSWPDQRAYLNKPADPTTGLDLLGARQYDPTTGRFLSVDPVLETGDQRQMNGYSYSADNPVNGSDPTGQMMGGPGGGTGDPGGCNIMSGNCRNGGPSPTQVGASGGTYSGWAPGSGSGGSGSGCTPAAGAGGCNANVFDPIGLGLVNIQETDPEYAALVDAYATALQTTPYKSTYSSEQYEIMLWEYACKTIQNICGGGRVGTLQWELDKQWEAAFVLGAPSGSEVFNPLLVGSAGDASGANASQLGLPVVGTVWAAKGITTYIPKNGVSPSLESGPTITPTTLDLPDGTQTVTYTVNVAGLSAPSPPIRIGVPLDEPGPLPFTPSGYPMPSGGPSTNPLNEWVLGGLDEAATPLGQRLGAFGGMLGVNWGNYDPMG